MTIRILAAAALVLTACGPTHNFVSPTTDQGPPPFIGPPEPTEEPLAASPDRAPPRPIEPRPAEPQGPAEPLTFVRTPNSDEWVSRNFIVQPKYKRVIVVGLATPAPKQITITPLALNNRGDSAGHTIVNVDASVGTLQDAAELAQGGDLVAVLPGTYQGFTIGDKLDAGDGNYIHFLALGDPGEVVIDRPTPTDKNWMIALWGAHHVIIEGFNLAGPNAAGKAPSGPNAGIFINGDFPKTSRLAHHIAIVRNYSHDHKKWGLHSVDSHTVLIQDSVFANSAMEHAAYVSDGSDDYVIRRNVFMNSPASGLQCNVDPLASLTKLQEHPAFADGPEYKPSREWALATLKTATEKFGPNRFPDGRGFNYLIEENVVTGTGKNGGAAINLAGVRESLIQNNLIYNNASSGIVNWDNANPFDAPYVIPGPKSPSDVVGPEQLPIFGCFSNVIRNNTVVMRAKSRPALLVGSGSWGMRVRNNILVNDLVSSVEIHTTGIWRLDADRNVLNSVVYEGNAAAFKSLAISLPDQPGSATGVTRARLAPNLAQPTDEPWVLLEKNWWKPNPRRPDYRPRPGSPLLAGTGDPRELPTLDFNGKKRDKADIGAFTPN